MLFTPLKRLHPLSHRFDPYEEFLTLFDAGAGLGSPSASMLHGSGRLGRGYGNPISAERLFEAGGRSAAGGVVDEERGRIRGWQCLTGWNNGDV